MNFRAGWRDPARGMLHCVDISKSFFTAGKEMIAKIKKEKSDAEKRFTIGNYILKFRLSSSCEKSTLLH